MSWYAMPPLLNATIKKDLGLTDNEVANSTILGGVASLLVRLIAGPLCDRFGPVRPSLALLSDSSLLLRARLTKSYGTQRYVLIGTLFLSAIPCGCAGLAKNALGLYFVRFFMGIAGAAFVPCQALMSAWCVPLSVYSVGRRARADAAAIEQVRQERHRHGVGVCGRLGRRRCRRCVSFSLYPYRESRELTLPSFPHLVSLALFSQ